MLVKKEQLDRRQFRLARKSDVFELSGLWRSPENQFGGRHGGEMFAQMFPGMEWIPLILLAGAVMFVGIVVTIAIMISRLLPLRSVQPQVAPKVRCGVAVTIAISILVWFALSHKPLGGPEPTKRIKLGMNADKVRAILGKPHERYRETEGRETWIYYRDWLCWDHYFVEFNREGKVDRQWDD